MLRFARMISGVRSDPWTSEAATGVGSDVQVDYTVEIRSDAQPDYAVEIRSAIATRNSINANESLIGCVSSMGLDDWLASSSMRHADWLCQ